MNQFLTLLKIEFLTKRNRMDKKSSIFSRVLKYLFMLVGAGVIGAVVVFALNSVLRICIDADIGQELLIFYILLVQIIQLLFGINMITKTLYFNNDKDLMKLPVKGVNIFLSKVCYLYIKELIFSAILTLPFFIQYGVLTSQGAGFYCVIPLAIVICSLIPFLLGLVLSVPTMYLIDFLKNKFVVMLGLYIIFVAVGFFVYITCLIFFLTLFETGDINSIFSTELVLQMKRIANYMYFSLLVKNLLFGYRFMVSLVVGVLICFILTVVVLFFANKVYFKILLKNNEGSNSSFDKKIKIKQRGVSRALFFREFLTIFRSTNYSFQYLTITITTPLMVYFSNAIASSVGIDVLGVNILPGISVLVLLMFLSMGSSFAATSITREGEQFFHTKIIPVPFKKQIFVKFMLYVIVSVPSIIVSCLVLALFGFIGYLTAFLMMLAVSLLVIGNICSSISLDIKKPQFMYLDGKELTQANSNTKSVLAQGFLIAALVGALSIVVSIVFNFSIFYAVLFGFAVPYFSIEVFRLFHKLEKRYRRIEA